MLGYVIIGSLTLQIASAEAPETSFNTYPEDLEPHKYFAYDLVKEKWGEEQWEYFNDLVTRESGWDNTVPNPTSTAFGLMQFLDSTWSGVGCVKTTDPDTQIKCGVKYIEQRYGDPKSAILFHNSNNHY